MTPRRTRNDAQRHSAERARIYQARTQVHADQIHRRVRDNVIAGVGGGVLLVLVFVSQAVLAGLPG